MESPSNQVQPSQILIKFKDPKSIEFDIQLSNVAASQMLLASQWLEIRAKIFIETAEKEKRDQLARLGESKSRILVPGLGALRGD